MLSENIEGHEKRPRFRDDTPLGSTRKNRYRPHFWVQERSTLRGLVAPRGGASGKHDPTRAVRTVAMGSSKNVQARRTGRSWSQPTISRSCKKTTFPWGRTGGHESDVAKPAFSARSNSLCKSARCDSTDCKTNQRRAAARAASPRTRAVFPCAQSRVNISGVCVPQKTQMLTDALSPLRAMSRTPF